MSCRPHKFLLDGTPIFHVKISRERLKETYPALLLAKKKFILVVREPIAREYSVYKYKLQACYDYVDEVESVEYQPGKHDDDTYFLYGLDACKALFPGLSFEKLAAVSDIKPLSFREYYTKGILVRDNGKYLEILRNWLEVISRDRIFIINMQTLIDNTTDSMARIQEFLGFSKGWGENKTLPHLNSASHVGGILDCPTKQELSRFYTKPNANFIDFVRNSTDKPSKEPFFPNFQEAVCGVEESGARKDDSKGGSSESDQSKSTKGTSKSKVSVVLLVYLLAFRHI